MRYVKDNCFLLLLPFWSELALQRVLFTRLAGLTESVPVLTIR